jgi:hypothetical protein
LLIQWLARLFGGASSLELLRMPSFVNEGLPNATGPGRMFDAVNKYFQPPTAEEGFVIFEHGTAGRATP